MLDDALRKLPKSVRVAEISITLMQEPDSCGLDEIQVLRISTEDAGGGPFVVLKTDRWALDKTDLDPLRDAIAAIIAHTEAAEADSGRHRERAALRDVGS
jgi:hypothetical protein